MRYVAPTRWPLPLLLGAGIGVVMGAIPLQELIMSRGGQPGLLNLALLNAILPLAALCMGVLYPRVRVAVFAGMLLGLGFWFGRMFDRDWRFWGWSARWLVTQTHPLHVVAMLGNSLAAALGAGVSKLWRRVGLPDEAQRCRRCGYLLTGAPGPRCPECGRRVRSTGTGG